MDGFLIVLLALCLAPALHLMLRRSLPRLLEWAGGLKVRRSLKAHLPESYYRQFDDIWLRTPRGTVHVDHLLVSCYGVFIIATRHDWGSISGSPQDAKWVRSLLGFKRSFPNPIRRNMDASRALQSLLDLDDSKIHSLSVFTGRSRFRESTPLNVTGLEGMLPFIQVRTEHLIGFDETERAIRVVSGCRTDPPPVQQRAQWALLPRYRNPRINGLVGAAAGATAMAALLILGSQVLKLAGNVVHTSPLPAYPEKSEESPFLPKAEKPEIQLPTLQKEGEEAGKPPEGNEKTGGQSMP